METAIRILQILSAIFLVLSILVQDRGTGLSATFGGSGGFYATKRGAEKVLSIITVVLMALFLVLSFTASIILS
jgi:protein translocase SecG subunit